MYLISHSHLLLQLDENILWAQIYPNASTMLRRAIVLAFHLEALWVDVRRIRWSDFDLENNTATVFKWIPGRRVRVDYSGNKPLLEWITTTYSEREPGSHYVVCRLVRGSWEPYEEIDSMWNDALAAAGLRKDAYLFDDVRQLAWEIMRA